MTLVATATAADGFAGAGAPRMDAGSARRPSGRLRFGQWCRGGEVGASPVGTGEWRMRAGWKRVRPLVRLGPWHRSASGACLPHDEAGLGEGLRCGLQVVQPRLQAHAQGRRGRRGVPFDLGAGPACAGQLALPEAGHRISESTALPDRESQARCRPWGMIVRIRGRADERDGGAVNERADRAEISTAKEAADHALVLAFGRLQGAANRLEYILGRALEQECGISHLMYEVLLILGRAGEPGLSMRALAQEQVLTTGGATRLVDRMVEAGLVERAEDPGDRRGRLVRLTAKGAQTAVSASRVHVENIRRYFLEPIPPADRDRFVDDLRILSHSARDALPRLP